jgi:hypothetical protein
MVHVAQQNFKLHIMFPFILQQHYKFVSMCVKKTISQPSLKSKTTSY